MLSIADYYLLRRRLPDRDTELAFRRIEGSPIGRTVYFLPWNTSFETARRFGLLPLDFLACYEAPPALVSSVPALCVVALHRLLEDALRIVRGCRATAAELCIVGLSIGTFPAAALAAELRARLCAVAPSDRGDLMIWQSRAAREVKQRAVLRGYTLDDYTRALAGLNPVDTLRRIAPASVFVLGRRDPFIPRPRREGLVREVAAADAGHAVYELDCGHVAAMLYSRPHQRALLAPAPQRSAAQPAAGTPVPSMRFGR